VHRIGRTGRAGKSGRAISLVPYRELFQIRNIERFANVRIQRGKVPTADEVAEARENVFLEKLRALLTSGGFRSQEKLLERLSEEGFSSTDIASALLHLLQSGETAKSVPHPEDYQRPQLDEGSGRYDDRRERAPDREGRRGRFDERRGYGHQDDRRPSFPERREARPPRAEGPGVQPIRHQSSSRRPTAPRPQERESLVERRNVEKSFGGTPEAGAKAIPASNSQLEPSVESQLETTTINPPGTKPALDKTYSDEEILASVKSPESKPGSKLFVKPKPAPAAPKPKASRATPQGQTRLWINLGETQGIKPIDIVNTVAGETGLPGKVVGAVDVREKHLFVDVAEEHVNSIVAKLNRAQIKGHKVKVKLA